uniref:Myotubularin phosphatase domain-containing protein n=1 Tax=Colobus angolensis palliatus TaxID=336983 RepID=A0A2K5HG16_COLAP
MFSLKPPRPTFRSYLLPPPQTDDKINSEPKIKKLEPVLLPGEIVVNEVNFVRKCIATDTSQYDLWGKLICSNFKISFITDDPMPLQKFHYRNLLLGEHDVPLTCIEQIVTVNDHKRKQKVLGPNQKLKFNPTELIIYCKDFRIVRFRFDESGPESAKKPTKLMEFPQEMEEEEEVMELVVAAARKLHSLKLTRIGTEKSRGQVLPGGEFVLLTRVT